MIGTLFFSCEVAEFLGSVFLLSLFLFWLLIKFQKKKKRELKEEREFFFFGSQLGDVFVVAGERYGRGRMLVTAAVSVAAGV